MKREHGEMCERRGERERERKPTERAHRAEMRELGEDLVSVVSVARVV